MADTDGSIAVSVDLNVSDAEKELARLKKRFLGFQSDLTESKGRKIALESELDKATQKLDEYRRRYKDGIIPDDDKIGQSLIAQADKINNEIEKTTDAIRDNEVALAGVKARYGELATEAERLKQIEADRAQQEAERAQQEAQQPQERKINTENAVRAGEAAQDATQKTSLLALALQKLNPVIGAISKGFAAAGKVGGVMVKTLGQGVLSLAKTAASSVQKAFSAVGKAAANIGKNILSAAKNVLSFNNAGRAAMPVFSRLGSLIKNAFVFNVISQGLNYVKQQLWDYLQTNTQFMTALSQLKTALASAFSPILSVVVPALTTFINWLTSAITAVAQFIAALFGKVIRFTKGTTAATNAGTAAAGKNAGAMEEQADAMEDVGEAAEEATKSLADFDEINVLATDHAEESAKTPSAGKTPSSSGGGGGGGGGGAWTPAGFVLEDAEKPFEDWGQAFSDFLDKILNEGIPKLREAFEKFAEWFNDFNQKLYDMFTFPGIEEKVILIGERLAEAFNHLVDMIDWELFGRALGAGLNLALQFLVSFIYSFDWFALGGALSQMLNGLVDEIDWYAFGQLLWARFKIALEMLAGFLSNLDMPALAQAASDTIMGFFDSMTETIQSIDWQQIGEQIREFLVNLDWEGIWTSIATAAGAALGAAFALFKGLLGEAWNGLVEWWHEVAFEDGHFTIQGLLDGIADVLLGIGAWIKDNIFTPFMDGFKAAFGIASPSTVMQEMGGYLIDGMQLGMETKWPNITSLIDTMKQFFGDSWTNIQQTTQETFQSVGDTIGSIWESIKSKVSETVNGMKEKLSTAWSDIKSAAQSGHDGLRSVFQSAWDGIVNIVSSAVSRIKGFISDVMSAASSIGSKVGDAVSSVFSGRSIALDTGVPVFPVPNFQVPALAAGAVIPPNRSFLAMLGDQPSGTNVEAPLSTIEEALQNVLNRNGNGDINIMFTGDLAQLARVLRPVIEREGKRIGGSLIGESIA